jgi:hypothetical protein
VSGEAPFTLVAGLSSSGKSTWLEGREAPVVIPFEFGNDLSALPEGALVHYNTLRYADNDAANLGRDFESDPFLQAVLARPGGFDAVYIAAAPAELARRIGRRRTVERGTGVYPRKGVARAIAALDQRAFHAAWLDLLERHARRLTLLLSEPGGFREVSREELLGAMTPALRGRLGGALRRLVGR